MERLAGRVILLWGWPRRLAAFVAGALATLALAPVDFPAICFAAFPVLVWLLDGTPVAGTFRQRFLPAFSAGWWFGFGWFLSGMWWLGVPFLSASPHAWALPLVVAGPPALLALFYGVATLIARLLWSDGVGRIAALAFGFGVVEWLRATLFPGSGWNAVGHAAMPVPLMMQAAQLVGIAGMSTLAVFVFSAPALLGTRLHAVGGLVMAGLLIAFQTGYGYVRIATHPEAETFLPVRIVQPALAPATPFEETFRAYLDLSATPVAEGAARRQLILWPELSVPDVLAERPDLLDKMTQIVSPDAVLVAGALRDEGKAGTRRLYNAALLIDQTGIADATDKLHLLPLRDYFAPPFIQRGAAAKREAEDELYLAGSVRRLLNISENVDALPLIGLEALASPPRDSMVRESDIILNPADYAAFSGTPASHQHLRQARIRAIQSDLPLLIATANGVSAAIDSRGRIVGALAGGTHGVLDVSLPLSRKEPTQIGDIALQGLTFSAIFGMFALLVTICVDISGRRN